MAKAWYVNPAKRRKSKKRRSAKQKAAFKRMIAGLRRYKAKGKKKSKKRRKKAAPVVTKRRKRRRKHAAKVVTKRRKSRVKCAPKRRRRRTKMARKVHRKRHHKGGKKRRSISFRRVPGSLYRRNPSGFLSSALGLAKSAGPGVAGAAVLDLYGIEPLLAKFNVDRALQPVIKIVLGLGVAALVDRFAPKYKRHGEVAAIGLMAIAAKEGIGRLADHPTSKLQDIADYYSGLNGLVEVPAGLGLLESGDGSLNSDINAVVRDQFSGWPEVWS